MRSSWTVAIVLVVVLRATGALIAETLALAPVADADVDSSQPTQISNGATLRAGRDPSMAGTPRYRAFLRFDVSGVPQGARLTGAILRLHLASSSSGGIVPLEARAVLAPWSETSLAWATQPATAAPSIVVPIGVDTSVPYDIPVAPLVEAWRTSATNQGLALTAQGEAGATGWRTFTSKETTVATQRPTLIITYDVLPDFEPRVLSPPCGSRWIFGQEVPFEAADARALCPDGPEDIRWYFRPFDEESEETCERFDPSLWAGVDPYQFTPGRLLGRDEAHGLSDRAIPFRGHWVLKVAMCGVESPESDFFVDYDEPVTGQIHPYFQDKDLDDDGSADIDWNDTDPVENHLTTAHFNVFWNTNEVERDNNGDPVLRDLDGDGQKDDETPIGDEMRPSDERLGLLECVYATLDHWMIAPLDPAALYFGREDLWNFRHLTCCAMGPGGGGQGVPLGIGWGQLARWNSMEHPDARDDTQAWVPVHELFHTFDYAGNPLHNRDAFDFRYTNNAYVFFHEATPAVEQSMAGGFPRPFDARTDTWPAWAPLDAGLLDLDYHAGAFWTFVVDRYETRPLLSWSGPPICACQYHAQTEPPHSFDLFDEWNRRVRERLLSELGEDYDLVRYGFDECTELHRKGPDSYFLYNGEVDPSCHQTVEFELAVLEEIARERALARGDPVAGEPLGESLLLDFAVAFAKAFPPGSLLEPFPAPVTCLPTDVSLSKGFGADDLLCGGIGNADFYARLKFSIDDDSIRYLRLVANDDATLYINGRAVIGEVDPTGSEPDPDFPDASTTYADQTKEWPFIDAPASCVFPIGNPRGKTFEVEWVNREDKVGNQDKSANRYLLALEKYDPQTRELTRLADLGDPVTVQDAELWISQGKGRPCDGQHEVQLRPAVQGGRPYLLPGLGAHYHPIAPPPDFSGDFTVEVRDDELTHTRASASLLTIGGDACNAAGGSRPVEWRGLLERRSPTIQTLRVHSDNSGRAAQVAGEPAVILVTAERTIHPEAPASFRPYGTLGAVHYTVTSYWPDRYDRGLLGNPPNDTFANAEALPNAADAFVASEGDVSSRRDLTVQELSLHVPEDIDHFRLTLPDLGPDCEVDLPECAGLAAAANGLLTVRAVGPLALLVHDDAGSLVRRYDDGYFEIGCPGTTGFSTVHFAVENVGDDALFYSLRIRYRVPDADVARAMSRFCDLARDEPGATREDDTFLVLDPIPRIGEGFIFGANCNTIICQPFKHDFLAFRWEETRTLAVEMESEASSTLALDLLDERFQRLAGGAAVGGHGGGAGDSPIQRLVLDDLTAGWYLLRLTGSQFGVPYALRFLDASAAPRFRRGDANADGRSDLSDAVRILGYLFLGDPPPACLEAADCNDSGGLEISDAIYLLGALFLGSSPIPPPAPDCGADPTPDSLSCASGEPCT